MEDLEVYENFKSLTSLWDREPFHQTQSQSSVILVLPDALMSKFYLQNKSTKKEKKDAQFQRDMDRYELKSRKDAASKFSKRKEGQLINEDKSFKPRHVL
jgi:hypothetical protein